MALLLFIGLLPLPAAADPYETYIQSSKDFKPVAQNESMLLKAWPNFVYMPWTYQWHIGYTPQSGQWSLDNGYNGAFIDHDDTGKKLDWINQFKLPFYVDHTAGKGDLHLWDGDAVKPHLNQLHSNGVRPKPLNASLMNALQAKIQHNIKASIASPYRAAYALDDEPAWGHFVHPTMWQVTDDKSAYQKWLTEIYGPAAPKRDNWITYNDLLPKLKTWNLKTFDASPLMDQWTFNDALWCNFVGDLVTYANTIDPQTPVGLVGGQNPSAFGGYDYARLMRKIQFIEAYNLGSSQAIIRSFNHGNAMPTVTTHFHQNVADTVWQTWYYLAHGNKGFIGWVDGWFEKDGTPKAWHKAVAPQFKEAEKLSAQLTGATFQHDGIAIYYSHPSIQLGWILDSQAHGKTWTNRNDDRRLGTSHLVRQAWENMLKDSGLQYNFINYVDVIPKGVPSEYKVLILPGCIALSDAEAKRITEFARNGGTVIADFLPGVWDQHGKGRPEGGALDALFGVHHDPALAPKDLFNGIDTLWVETDQDANYGYKTYDELLTKANSCLKDESGFNKAVRAMQTPKPVTVGKGKAILFNLSPQWYNAYRAQGFEAAQKRKIFLDAVNIAPQVTLAGASEKEFGWEITRWKKGNRTLLFITQNPELTGSQTGGGNAKTLKTDSVEVTLQFKSPVKNAKDERSATPFAPSATELKFNWIMNQAAVISYE